jgi:hypothetical protein
MKTCTLLLSLVLAAAMATTADAAKRSKHHHRAATASTTDWPGNPYSDLTEAQRDRFFRDAFNPAAAK